MNVGAQAGRWPTGVEALVALGYALLGWGSLQIAIPPDYVSLVFLPAGLAVAAVLLRGARALPAVFVGAWGVQAIAYAQVGVAGWSWTMLVPAAGATLQAAVTAWAVRRWLGFPEPLDTPATVVGFMALVVPLGSGINACVSVPALVASGIIPLSEMVYSLWTWWIGDALGVALLVPMLLALFARPASAWRPHARTVALPMLVALVLVLVAIAMVRSTQERALQDRFQRDAADAGQRVQHRLEALTDDVGAVARLMALSDDVDPNDFRQATESWLGRYPGTLNFGWSPMVEAARRGEFERRYSELHHMKVRILGRDGEGATYVAGPGARYLPIGLIEPMATNRQVLGLDVMVLPATAAAVRGSIESGRAQVSGALRLVQETGQQQGVVIYQAVFEPGQPQVVRGVVSAAVRLGDLMTATLGDVASRGLRICLIDLDAPQDRRRLAGPSGCDLPAAHGASSMPLSQVTSLMFGQQPWALVVEPERDYLSRARDWTAWAVTATGLAAVGLLGAFLLVITGQNRRTQRLVEQRTHELAQSNATLTQLAHFDPLTGLYNRAQWLTQAHQILDDARRHDDGLAVVFVDIDRFKHINDSLGHSQGDLLLSTLAQRMKTCLRGRDVLARLGGDEFVVLLPRLHDRSGAARAAGKLLQEMTLPVALQGHDVSVSASIGVAYFPDDAGSIEELVQRADIAMYAAKDAGRNTVRFFSRDMQERLSEHLLLERELRRALAEGDGQLYLEYQPQIDLQHSAAAGSAHDAQLLLEYPSPPGSNGVTVVGVEALLRWRHPTLGSIPPDRFIPVAEQCGLIEELGRWVLRRACLQLREWEENGWVSMRVAVNVSAQSFCQPQFVAAVARTLADTGAAAHRLELEITESLLMQPQAEIQERLMALTALGVSLALDDFGTGYSSLGYLKRLPLAKLKIDRTFLADVPGNAEDEALVRAIVSMAHDLGLKVLAEGLETTAQRDFLLRHGCDQAQGWLIARAMPPQELQRWLLRAVNRTSDAIDLATA